MYNVVYTGIKNILESYCHMELPGYSFKDMCRLQERYTQSAYTDTEKQIQLQ